jgi:hypothetical protein
LHNILNQCITNYRVLSIDESRYSHYETHYFDTPGFEMYLQHHNGKLNRNKIRFRDYVDTGVSFFEIKLKTNKGRTIKNRVKFNNRKYEITGQSELLLKQHTHFYTENLLEVIQVNYDRITLVQSNMNERLTIDFNLTFSYQNRKKSFPSLVIAEIKQDKTSKSPFIELMQANFIHSFSISKYCLGIASIRTNVKHNNFKSKLHTINKLCHENAS